jgi:hypothetical protein
MTFLSPFCHGAAEPFWALLELLPLRNLMPLCAPYLGQLLGKVKHEMISQK